MKLKQNIYFKMAVILVCALVFNCEMIMASIQRGFRFWN